MRLRVVYVINGTTCNDYLEAPKFSTMIKGRGIGQVQFFREDGTRYKYITYRRCEEIEILDEETTEEVA